jgi:hypothetical protein
MPDVDPVLATLLVLVGGGNMMAMKWAIIAVWFVLAFLIAIPLSPVIGMAIFVYRKWGARGWLVLIAVLVVINIVLITAFTVPHK